MRHTTFKDFIPGGTLMKFLKIGCLAIIVIIVLIIIIGALSGGDEDKPTKVGNNADTSETTENNNTEEAPAKEEYAVGEAVQLGDNILTVTNVEKSTGDEYDKPKQGHEYVVVTVKIENAGNDNISYNPYDFKMSNSQGQILDPAISIIDTDTALQSGELAAGGTVSGTIVFEQPAGDPGLQLQYTPSFWSDETIKINMQ